MTKTALVTGVSGQDGSYMAEYLLGLGYKVFGTTRQNLHHFPHHHLFGNSNFTYIFRYSDLEKDLFDNGASIFDEIYHFASPNAISRSYDEPYDYNRGIVFETIDLLNYVKKYQPTTPTFFASSCEVWSVTQSPYSIFKRAANDLIRLYQSECDLNLYIGHLYNHVSERSRDTLLIPKIIKYAKSVKAGTQKWTLGLHEGVSQRSYGWAPVFVETIHQQIQLGGAREFAVKTVGDTTPKKIVEYVFSKLGITPCGVMYGDYPFRNAPKPQSPVAELTLNHCWMDVIDLLLRDEKSA